MGMWPFRRKSNRRQSRGGAEIPRSEEAMHDAGNQRDPGRHNEGDLDSTGPGRRRSRRDSLKRRKSSKDSKKLEKRRFSFSSGRNDSISVPQDTNRPPIPPIPLKHQVNATRGDTEKPGQSAVNHKLPRASTQPPETTDQQWQRVPTLHKRSAQDLARRKSSKKRKEEHDREAEIKAMVAFMPTRAATDSISSGRPMKKENKKIPGGLLQPSSDISLPLAESIHSSLSATSWNQTSYKLSALEMLAPRPTIRYSETSRYATGAGGFETSEKSESRKRRASERISVPAGAFNTHKRIDDLADDLDAGQLRELMERDQKRKEKKKIADQIKAEQRLARRQEKQRAGEATAARDGTPPPVNMERGVLGRDVVGLGIGSSAVVTSSKRKSSTPAQNERPRRPAEASRQASATSGRNPFSDFHRTESQASEGVTPYYEPEEAVIETAQVGTVAKAQVSPPPSPRGHVRGASSISQMMDLPKPDRSEAPVVAKIPEPVRQYSSESSSRQPSQSWTSFFKRSKTKRASIPSSFSNTSRDSMQTNHGPQIGYTPMRSTSNIPKRTMSKFREDLPELPLSPPDSRVTSPEADILPPIRTDYPRGSRMSTDDPRARNDTPTSLEAMRARNETPTSGCRSVQAPSPEPSAVLSQSLASIDSEGSWLSGRQGGSKRGSAQSPSHPLRDVQVSPGPYNAHPDEVQEPEEAGIAEDEYFSRLSPEPNEQHRLNRQSAANASSDEEEGGSMGSPVSTSGPTKWGAVTRQATVVHREPRAKSQEGLLNDFDTDSGSEFPADTPLDIVTRKSYGFKKEMIQGDEVSIHRASSIDLGRAHARHISAGSARLLELKKSADGKRLSSG